MSDKEDEVSFFSFLFKLVFSFFLLYVVSYFSGYHRMIMEFLYDAFKPVIADIYQVRRTIDMELQKRGIYILNGSVRYIPPEKRIPESWYHGNSDPDSSND